MGEERPLAFHDTYDASGAALAALLVEAAAGLTARQISTSLCVNIALLRGARSGGEGLSSEGRMGNWVRHLVAILAKVISGAALQTAKQLGAVELV